MSWHRLPGRSAHDRRKRQSGSARTNAIKLAHSVLVLVDYQQRLMPALHGGDRAVAEALRLADAALALEVPVLGTEQNPAGLGANLALIRQRCRRTLAKTHFDACADGLLEAIASSRTAAAAGPFDVVLAGCESHVCLMQTGLGLLRAGHRVWVVADACASRLPINHALAMQRLQQAGATLVAFEMVVFEWLQHCKHERFKAVLAMLKAPLQTLRIEDHLMSKTNPPLTHEQLLAFESRLSADGFVELQTREIPAGTQNAEHCHDFEVKAMMLDGELQLTCEGHLTTYRAGDVFTMAAGKLHSEQFGDSSTSYLVGRKYRA